MKFYQLLILLIAVILLTPSCSRTNEQLLQAEQLIETAPDSAMAILNKYNYNKLSDKDKALYGLVSFEFLNKKLLPLKPDSFINYSINYYSKHPDNNRLATCYLYKGKVYKYNYQYDKAMNCYLKALDLVTTKRDNALLGRIYFDMADIHSFQSDFDIARIKYKKAYQYLRYAKLNSQSFYSLLNIGRTYYLAKNYTKAENYYRQLVNLANDSILKGALYQEIGQNFYKNTKYDSALYYLNKAKTYPYLGINKAIRLSFLSRAYFDTQSYDSALYYAKQTFKFQPDIRLQRESYRIMTNCEFIKGNQKNVTAYMNKYVTLGNSIYLLDKEQTKGSYIETMHNTQREVAKSHSWIWYLSIFVLMIIIVSVMLYLRKHKKSVLEMKMAGENQLKQKAELRHEVVNKSRQAVETTIRERRNEMMAKNKNSNPEFRRKLINRLYGEVIHFNDKTYFKKEMDAIMNNLYSKLESRYPELNEKEVQWACLYELNVSRDDIMDLLDFKLESYKKMRQRFAQKTGVNYIKSIDELLEKILTE